MSEKVALAYWWATDSSKNKIREEKMLASIGN
jgi:hypothetical protein